MVSMLRKVDGSHSGLDFAELALKDEVVSAFEALLSFHLYCIHVVIDFFHKHYAPSLSVA